MLVRNIEREDLNIHYLKLLNELGAGSTRLNVDIDLGKSWDTFVKNDDHHIVVCVYGSHVVATAALIIERKIDCRVAGHIEDVVVSKNHRGSGMGSVLVKELMEIAKRENCYKVILDCSFENIPFYRKLGFWKESYGMKTVVHRSENSIGKTESL